MLVLCTWQKRATSFKTGRIRTRNPSRPAVTDISLKPCGHWGLLIFLYSYDFVRFFLSQFMYHLALAGVYFNLKGQQHIKKPFCVAALTLNIPSLGRQRFLPSWGPRRTPWFFCNFSTVWCGRLLKLCFLGFWNYNSVIQALLVSNILCLFISTEVCQ